MIEKPPESSDNLNNQVPTTIKNKEKKATVETRKEIGFLADPNDWVNAPATYSFVDGQEVLTIAGHPVMEGWEAGYMQELADIASSRGGDVLELGYGLGLSAKAIQSHPIKSYTVIEANKDVVQKRAQGDLEEAIAKGSARILSGLWEKVIPTLPDESFDGILFDTYPLTEEDIHGNHFPFFAEAYRILRTNSIFTYYSDVATEEEFLRINVPRLVQAGFKRENISCRICKVQPPADCKYWKDQTIIVPVITK